MAKVNFSEIISVLPENIQGSFAELIVFLKAASVAFIAYVIYLLIRFIFTWQNHHRIKKIETSIEEIKETIDSMAKSIKKSKKKDFLKNKKKS